MRMGSLRIEAIPGQPQTISVVVPGFSTIERVVTPGAGVVQLGQMTLSGVAVGSGTVPATVAAVEGEAGPEPRPSALTGSNSAAAAV